MANGTVKFFKEEHGWGAISSPELPEGCDAFAHFSVIEGPGYRALTAGDVVEFEYEPCVQDGFSFRATRALKVGDSPA